MSPFEGWRVGPCQRKDLVPHRQLEAGPSGPGEGEGEAGGTRSGQDVITRGHGLTLGRGQRACPGGVESMTKTCAREQERPGGRGARLELRATQSCRCGGGSWGRRGLARTGEGRESGREEVERHLPPRYTYHSARGERERDTHCFSVLSGEDFFFLGGGGKEDFVLFFSFSFF